MTKSGEKHSLPSEKVTHTAQSTHHGFTDKLVLLSLFSLQLEREGDSGFLSLLTTRQFSNGTVSALHVTASLLIGVLTLKTYFMVFW